MNCGPVKHATAPSMHSHIQHLNSNSNSKFKLTFGIQVWNSNSKSIFQIQTRNQKSVSQFKFNVQSSKHIKLYSIFQGDSSNSLSDYWCIIPSPSVLLPNQSLYFMDTIIKWYISHFAIYGLEWSDDHLFTTPTPLFYHHIATCIENFQSWWCCIWSFVV